MQLFVDSHTHTLASGHAYSTVIENAAAAAEKGLALFCMTDHASTMPGAPHYWHFANQRVIPRILSGVGVLRGVEANILNTDGEIDIPGFLDNQLDWVLASFHEPVFRPDNREVHTRALIETIRSGRVHVIGHPGNPSFDFDFETVIKEAVEHNVVLEINNSSLSGSRQGSAPRCEEIAACIKELGGRITTGSDAHFAFDVGNLSRVVALLDKVGFPQESIISHHPRCFLDFLEERGAEPIAELSHL